MRLIYLTLMIFTIFWAGVGFAIFHDESPDVGRDEFYALSSKTIPDNQNLAIAMAGLDAPSGEDIIQHGRFAVDIWKETGGTVEVKKIVNFKLLNDKKTPLSFVGKSEEFDCWLDYPAPESKENCASAERIQSLLVENKELLSRYASLANMPTFRGMGSNGQIIINLNRLLAAEIKLDIEAGNSELAYSKWLKNHQFINHVFGQEGVLIDHAIFLVIDDFNLYALENLLLKSPEIGEKHFDELNAMLKTKGLERYNLAGMTKAEYAYYNELFYEKQAKTAYLHPEFIRNRMYRFHLEYLKQVQNSPSAYGNIQVDLNEKYGKVMVLDKGWLDPFNNVLFKRQSSGFIKSFSLLSSMHAKNALMKLLNLSIQIRQQKITGSKVQTFLNDAGAEYNCPFTNKPMQWDAAKNTIYCKNPEAQPRVAEVRL